MVWPDNLNAALNIISTVEALWDEAQPLMLKETKGFHNTGLYSAQQRPTKARMAPVTFARQHLSLVNTLAHLILEFGSGV